MLEATTNCYELAGSESLGQCVFYPPSVKGWDGGRTWINSATLLERTNLVGRIVEHKQTRFAGGSLESLAARLDRRSPESWVDWAVEMLLATNIPGPVRERLVAIAGEQGDGRSRQLGRVIHAISALPEFQLA